MAHHDVGQMNTILDIDLDFFVTPIVHDVNSDARVDERDVTHCSLEEVERFLSERCFVKKGKQYSGAAFEHHDQLFDWVLSNFNKPVRLIHVDAHADIGGGFTRCWTYVLTEYSHLPIERRRFPRRGPRHMNCGNFIVFMAACDLLAEVQFVSHPDWRDDYNGLYMKDFDSSSEAITLKRFNPETVRDTMLTPLSNMAHETEAPIPFKRIPMMNYQANTEPDFITITRSPGYTPKSADLIFEYVKSKIKGT